MNTDPSLRRRKWATILWLSLLPLLLVVTLHRAAPGEVQGAENGVTAVEQIEPHLIYGFNMALWDEARVNSIGFNGVKLFSPPGHRMPFRVLLRVSAEAGHMADLDGFAANLHQLAQTYGPYIDAYEIGNETNLDASYGWHAPPIASDYTQLLCRAYQAIKTADPHSVVVSAGLAPTGRVTGNWNGHAGHNGLYQDEREYLREMFQSGAGDCLDAVGYHPYGFRADFDAEPDISSGNPDISCANGFCFRGVEKIYEIMAHEYGLGHKEVWATEFGWIVEPPAECLDDPGWQGRQWQIVSEAKQASNLAGAFQYAHENYPWMGGMYVFNLNFNQAPYYPLCEQMRFYSVADRPAEAALTALEKFPLRGRMEGVGGDSFAAFVKTDEQPLTIHFQTQLRNTGWEPFTFTATVMTPFPTAISPMQAVLPPGETAVISMTLLSEGLDPGIYQGAVYFTADASAANQLWPVSLMIWVADEWERVYLAIVHK
jgi:hypothetical protein